MPKLDEQLPEQPMVDLENPFIDDRGVIQNLLERPTGSTVIITSKVGAKRANHYHKSDWHFCYLVSGRMDYYHRPVGQESAPEKIDVGAGEMVFTPPMVEHAMVFTEETVFITLARNARDHEAYETDLVRVDVA
jgi:uncharacterized RmlC-like cupin family protein